MQNAPSNAQETLQQTTSTSPSPAMRIVKLAPDFDAQMEAYNEDYSYEPRVLSIYSDTYEDTDANGAGYGWISQFEAGAYTEDYQY